MPSSPPDKASLRARFRAERLDLAEDERERLSDMAAARLLADPVWKNARAVALYAAVRGETGTSALLAAAFASGKQVLLPGCANADGQMELLLCSGPHALQTGAYGIPEPVVEASGGGRAAEPPGLIVMPGVAFDREGYRLGMGGGYYDRFLARPENRACPRIGFAYAFQIVDRLPRESWDMPVHALCTEKGLTWIQRP